MPDQSNEEVIKSFYIIMENVPTLRMNIIINLLKANINHTPPT